ncbi:MAG: hypothetical protein HY078_06695 [Elusimicrobia bacterium]|nr:hypothetical protein [Elusimicrobiota bacterium]
MSLLPLAAAALLSHAPVAAPDVAQDCASQWESPKPIHFKKELPFDQTLEEMDRRFEELLASGRRLEYRGFRRAGRFVLPYFNTNLTGMTTPMYEVVFPDALVDAIRVHAETAFARGYALYPFFSDFGHGHLMHSDAFNAALAERVTREGLSGQQQFQAALDDPDLKILYHASEQLVFPGDARARGEAIEFLRKHRNIVGGVREPAAIVALPDLGGVNTAGAPAGWSFGGMFYVSAARQACVPIAHRGRALYFDIGLVGGVAGLSNDDGDGN